MGRGRPVCFPHEGYIREDSNRAYKTWKLHFTSQLCIHTNVPYWNQQKPTRHKCVILAWFLSDKFLFPSAIRSNSSRDVVHQHYWNLAKTTAFIQVFENVLFSTEKEASASISKQRSTVNVDISRERMQKRGMRKGWGWRHEPCCRWKKARVFTRLNHKNIQKCAF